VVSPLKEFVARPRPYAVLTGIHPVLVEKSFSFPSYHATVAFMAATIMSFFFRPRYIFFIFAVTIAFSRVYLGVHYPSDALAGAGLGAMIGYVLVKTSSKAFPT
jgi:undecaprenyl-diphosphatase